MSMKSPDQILATPAEDLAALSPEAIMQLRSNASELLSVATAVTDRINKAIDLKYAKRAQVLRLAAGKDTGVVHFDDGAVRITADLAKSIEWDQKKLTDIVRRIAASGDDPTQYVEIKYRVSETKFNAWPDSLKSAFLPARTLKTGKSDFRLALVQEQHE